MSRHPGKPTDDEQDAAAEAFYGDQGADAALVAPRPPELPVHERCSNPRCQRDGTCQDEHDCLVAPREPKVALLAAETWIQESEQSDVPLNARERAAYNALTLCVVNLRSTS
jgi:hypothetical protein